MDFVRFVNVLVLKPQQVVDRSDCMQTNFECPKAFAEQVTLTKEGTTAGYGGNLWVDIITWKNVLAQNSQPPFLLSGISDTEQSITYEQEDDFHCHGGVYGYHLPSLETAKSTCTGDPECGAVYLQNFIINDFFVIFDAPVAFWRFRYDMTCQEMEYKVPLLQASDAATY